MALQLYRVVFSQTFFSVHTPTQNLLQKVKGNSRQYPSIRCAAKKKNSNVNSGSPIYQPTNWSHDFIETLDTNFPINFKEKAKELQKKVMALNVDYENGNFSTFLLLEHIDNIERLGLGYRFENDIRRALNVVAAINEINIGHEGKEGSLHAECLRFRLLRTHGYNVSQDFLRRFKDTHGGFMGCLQTDIKGLVSLYEASYLSFEWERDLQEAKLFATEHLRKLKSSEKEVLEEINDALELPLYRTMLRLKARWYIDAYSKRKDANLVLLELATLDFNMVQSEFKDEAGKSSQIQENDSVPELKIVVLERTTEKILEHLQESVVQKDPPFFHQIFCFFLETRVQISMDFKNYQSLASKLSLVRDRLMECLFWAVGVVFDPQYYSCRVGLTKVCCIITVTDDIYDEYGSRDELKIFTDAVMRMDSNAVKHMPEYLQLGFGEIYNTIIEMGSDTSIAQGEDIIPVLVKVWGELLEAFFVEANWSHNKYIPTLHDYLDNAWRSASGVVILTHAYFLINHEIKEDVGQSLEKYREIFKWSSMVFRLCNDLVTSLNEIERGKTANAISCYMHENGVGAEAAGQYIKILIDQAWRKLIQARMAFSQEYSNDAIVDMAINLARTSQCMYQYGDGHGAPDARAKDRVSSVLIEPIPVKERDYYQDT